jgi:hypothetical protein
LEGSDIALATFETAGPSLAAVATQPSIVLFEKVANCFKLMLVKLVLEVFFNMFEQ